MEALYRKYRPTTFKDVVGQEQILNERSKMQSSRGKSLMPICFAALAVPVKQPWLVFFCEGAPLRTGSYCRT